MTIPKYLATYGHTVERFSNDKTQFCKWFGFSIAGIDELREKLGDFGLELDKDLFILNINEAHEVLAGSGCNQEDDIPE